MAKNLSAVKKAQISSRNNARNRNYKSTIKTLIKKTLLEINNLESINYERANFFLSQVYSTIDKAVKKGIIAKNSAARKKSTLSHKLKNIQKG